MMPFVCSEWGTWKTFNQDGESSNRNSNRRL